MPLPLSLSEDGVVAEARHDLPKGPKLHIVIVYMIIFIVQINGIARATEIPISFVIRYSWKFRS
jgi:hypothetical protein